MENGELDLDVRIRDWVLIPVALVTFCMGILLQSIGPLVKKPPKVEQHNVRDASCLMRLNAFKKNGGSVLPPSQFAARLMYFTDGIVSEQRPQKGMMSTFMNPEFMFARAIDMMTTIMPQMLFGAWVRYTFGGFAVCKVPLPLPQTFKKMLQSGIEFTSRDLDASYVSALSWYVLCLFGAQGIYRLIITPPQGNMEESKSAALSGVSLSAMITDQVQNSWNQQMHKEKETLKRLRCRWNIPQAEDQLLQMRIPTSEVTDSS